MYVANRKYFHDGSQPLEVWSSYSCIVILLVYHNKV